MSDPEASTPQPELPRIRLQRFLAACGLGSRRHCEEFIEKGRVTVDGQPVTELGTTVDPVAQTIALDGEPLRMERKKYYMVNKPVGILCTNRDPGGRPRVIDLFPPGGPRLFTVGRLDESSEGLLVVTNDGDLAQKLAHPRYRFFRTYHVQVAGHPTRETLSQLKQGMYFSDGKFRVVDVNPLKKQGKSTHLELVLAEGQNREIRRLLARVGHKVMTLRRVAFGPLKIGRLKPGEHRELRREELAALFDLLAKNQAKSAGGRPRSGGGRPAGPGRGPGPGRRRRTGKGAKKAARPKARRGAARTRRR